MVETLKKSGLCLKTRFIVFLDVIVQMLEGSWNFRLCTVLSFYPMCSLPISPSLALFVWGDSDCYFSGELSVHFYLPSV